MAHGAHFGVPPVAPGGAVDPFTQQLIDAGLVDDQAQLLAQQIKHGQGLMQTPGAQGMNVGGTYVAGNPLEHFSVALSRIMGGRMAHDAQQGIAKGIETKRAGRQAFAGAQSGLPGIPSAEELLAPPAQPQWSPPDLGGPSPMVDGVTGTPAQRLAGAMDARSKLGMAGALSGDPVISQGAQGLLGEARGLGQTGTTVALGNRQYGLDTQKLEASTAAQRAEEAYRQAALEETARAHRADEGLKRAGLEQDAWKTVPDPMGGGFIQWNSKTGEYRTVQPGSAPPPAAGAQAGSPPLPGLPGKPGEDQRKKVLAASQSIKQLDMAIDALDKAPGAYGGVGNFFAGLAESAGGTPAQSVMSRRYSPGELRVKNYVSNVVSAIINERAGANVTLREELRQKFLPQDTDGLDQAKQKLRDLRDMQAVTYSAQGNGRLPDPNQPAAPTRTPVTRDGVTRYWNGTSWED